MLESFVRASSLLGASELSSDKEGDNPAKSKKKVKMREVVNHEGSLMIPVSYKDSLLFWACDSCLK